ncbi:hypothetical protein KDA_05760 [Dictyobacter alpinus]|uniref:Coenzyme Q-binding protein COQ10 START domain-containing protein n=1 Tax=Dictyobacter alpinus TaxID=2014873 RepID=A0A402B176_9CHLR|nr:SRPBCC family protein [Dictyobacter alpinus]GCE25092.1 hypothetical protein KDA_05760 [Dictyobacter alpinus]
MNNVNVHQTERIASTALGGALILQSFKHLSPGKTALAGALLYRGISGHSYLYQMLNVNTAQVQKQPSNSGVRVEGSITVGKTAQELYHFWSEPRYLAQIMGEFADVTQVDDNRMHWALRFPLDQHIEWDTQIIEDRPNELIRWKSLEGAQIANEGSVRFQRAPKDWGTEVTLSFCFDAPGGALGNWASKKLDIVPRMLAEKLLRRFKSLVETGEIPTLEHNPAARKAAYADATIH